MPRKALPERSVVFKGIENGVLILIDTTYDFESLIKIVIKRIKANKKFFQNTQIFINGTDKDLDIDEIGTARKTIFDKTGIKVLPVKDLSPKLDQAKGIVPEIIRKTFRAGCEYNFNNDIIIFGDINPGAKIISKGSIIVYGRIRGEVHAGETGNISCIITANGLNPISLSIGGISFDTESIEELAKTNFSYAKIVDGKVIIGILEENKDE